MRRELKYLIREDDLPWLRARLERFVGLDPHAARGENEYTVRSVYFDTPGLKDYHEKQAGILRRRKLRIRAYDQPADDKGIFLEVKQKNESVVWKDRAVLPTDTAARLLAGTLPKSCVAPSELEAVNRFLFWLRSQRRKAVLLVTYDREPWVGRFDPSLRITLDRRLRCLPYPVLKPDLSGLYTEDGLRPFLRGHFIMEVKFDRVFPSWLRPVLSEKSLSRRALSKYTLGLMAAARGFAWRFGGPPAVRSLARPRLPS